MHWKSPALPRMKKPRMSKSKFKAKLIVMTERVPEGQTVNQTYYLKVSATLREQVRKKWPELGEKKKVMDLIPG